MEIETSTLMMMFFIILFIISIWKIYAFLPNEALADDDTTKESQDELIKIIIKVIQESDGNLDLNQLFNLVTDNQDFDSEHYWRFNHNRLKQLLNQYYIKNPQCSSIKDIYKTNQHRE